MVRITNGKVTSNVPKGAYKMLYKDMGFKVIGEKNDADVKDEANESEEAGSEDNAVSDDEFIEQLLEKPLGEWSKEEVKKFAELKDIDISGTKKVTEAKNIIRSFLELNEA